MDELDGLDWSHKVGDIREPRSIKRIASDDECAVISGVFGDVVCRSLRTTYEIHPLAPGRYRARGNVEARVEQVCGVTLDPVEQQIAETFDVEFRAGARREIEHDPDFDALAEDEPEPIKHGEIEIGRFVCEVVASAIDPFPRAEDAELDWVESGHSGAPDNPFGALRQLKIEPKSD